MLVSNQTWKVVLAVMLCLLIAVVLVGCSGDTGDTGPAGPAGPSGPPGDDGEPGAGTVPLRVLDVFGNPMSAGITIYARFVADPPDYTAAPAQVAPAQASPQGVGDFQFVLPPGYYDIWLVKSFLGVNLLDNTQGKKTNVLVKLGSNTTVTLYAPTPVAANAFDSNGPISGGKNTISGNTTWAWWKFTQIVNPNANETWIWSSMTKASGNPQVTMVASWLRANNEFGTQDGVFNFTVNTSNGEALGGKMPAVGAGDVTTKAGLSIGGINGQPNVFADQNSLVLIQAKGDLDREP